ncbi:MAG: head GIN domain-containing protein [Sediminibacterium sp.]|jgi:ribosomal protein L30E|nr:DUF2807 domain-containing protein [Chitinophagaceae bacterium]MCA6446819.1 DUF2807 domain-containing protein [Chitinophagaceae bacterium]
MKKIFLLAAGFFVLSANIFAQKEVIESNIQKRNIGAFTKIESSSGIEVILTKGNKEELGVVVGDQHYINEVKTVVSNGTLKISREGEWKFWNTWKNWKVKVYVSYVNLESIDVSSGSSVKGEGLDLNKLSVDLNSGAIVELAGKVGTLNVDASSGAGFRGYNLKATKCIAESSSGAGIQITVDKEISADASSGGYIRYKGEGLIRNIDVSSGGSVKKQS